MNRLTDARLITAIKTPYTRSGAIDMPAFDAQMEKQIAAGIDGIVIAGTTGEGHLMNWPEQLALTAHSVEKFGDKVLIIGNTGSNSTREAIDATREGFAHGMHAALQVNPYYGRTSDEGMKLHFSYLMDLGPAILYNVPVRTGQDIPPHVVEVLSQHPNFVGMKECAGLDRIAYYNARGIRAWSGNDTDILTEVGNRDVFGFISVISNVFPELMHDAVYHRDVTKAARLSAVLDWLSLAPNPIPVNTMLAMMDRCQPVFKLPYTPLSAEQRRAGLDIVATLDATIPMREVADDEFVLL